MSLKEAGVKFAFVTLHTGPGTFKPVTAAKLEELFSGLWIEGRKVIKSVCRREDIYSGLQFENAPDIVLVGAEGFNLKGAIGAKEVYSKGIFTGKHTQDTAFLIVRGNTSVPQAPKVSDIRSIIES